MAIWPLDRNGLKEIVVWNEPPQKPLDPSLTLWIPEYGIEWFMTNIIIV